MPGWMPSDPLGGDLGGRYGHPPNSHQIARTETAEDRRFGRLGGACAREGAATVIAG
jgi:hypothetical protein